MSPYRSGNPLRVIAACSIVLLSTHSASAETIVLRAKSYISKVDLSDASQFDSDAASCQAAMAAIVTCGTLNGDNPTDGRKASKNFRLWSNLEVDLQCSAGKITKWKIKDPNIDFGTEFVFLTTSGDLIKPLNAVPSAAGSTPVPKVTFSYRMRGQPNGLGNATMTAVKVRTCTYIWHEISGSLSCNGDTPVVEATIAGSKFPSHKLWRDNELVQSIPQGPFKNLWHCDSMDPSSVE